MGFQIERVGVGQKARKTMSDLFAVFFFDPDIDLHELPPDPEI
jgi:hypothetical protein